MLTKMRRNVPDFGVCAMIAVLALAVVPVAPATAGPAAFAVADDPRGDGPQYPDADDDTSGSARGGQDFDSPSEDGTDGAPGAARPDRPPGCNFQDGPLELLV